MDVYKNIEKIKKALTERSKESIINDICNGLCSYNIEEIAWMFDIQLED